MDYDDYSKACDEIRAKNSEYLDLFEQALIEDGLKGSTIKRHLSNIDFYINDFLLYEEPLAMDYGMGRSIPSLEISSYVNVCGLHPGI